MNTSWCRRKWVLISSCGNAIIAEFTHNRLQEAAITISLTTTATGFDVRYLSPCGGGGVIFRDTATADEARAAVEKLFADDNFPATIIEVEPTRHTADRVTYLAMGGFAWGHGDTVEEARKNLGKQGVRKSEYYILIEFPVGVSFRGPTGLCGYRWEIIDPALEDFQPVEREFNKKRR